MRRLWIISLLFISFHLVHKYGMMYILGHWVSCQCQKKNVHMVVKEYNSYVIIQLHGIKNSELQWENHSSMISINFHNNHVVNVCNSTVNNRYNIAIYPRRITISSKEFNIFPHCNIISMGKNITFFLKKNNILIGNGDLSGNNICHLMNIVSYDNPQTNLRKILRNYQGFLKYLSMYNHTPGLMDLEKSKKYKDLFLYHREKCIINSSIKIYYFHDKIYKITLDEELNPCLMFYLLFLSKYYTVSFSLLSNLFEYTGSMEKNIGIIYHNILTNIILNHRDKTMITRLFNKRCNYYTTDSILLRKLLNKNPYIL